MTTKTKKPKKTTKKISNKMGGMIISSNLKLSQQKLLQKHGVHHSEKHMKHMINDMKKGKTFTQAHKNAVKKVGK